MEIIDQDREIVVCLKPAGVLSTDEPGGVPELLREQLQTEEIRTVHRLDRVVGGLMLLARSAEAASELSRQIRDGDFDKRYLAVVHGETPDRGELRDLLLRDKAERKTYVVTAPGKGVQEAVLRYETAGRAEGLSLVRIELVTGTPTRSAASFLPAPGRSWATGNTACWTTAATSPSGRIFWPSGTRQAAIAALFCAAPGEMALDRVP